MRIVNPDTAAPRGEPKPILAIAEHGFDYGMEQAIGRRKPAEAITILVEHSLRGAEPRPSLPVALNFAQAANQIYLNRQKGTIGIVVENVSIARQTNPHLAGMILVLRYVANVGLGKPLFLFVAVERLAVEADEIVKSKPQMAGGILGNAPTLLGPVRRRKLLVVLLVERD